MKKLLITNLVYGPVYAELFCNQHLKSLVDPTNLAAHQERIEYAIFTDEETKKVLEENKYFQTLEGLANRVTVNQIDWKVTEEQTGQKLSTEAERYNFRYGGLVSILQWSINFAMAHKDQYYLSTIVADLVFAQNFFDKIFEKLDEGHDAIFMHPLRAAASPPMIDFLNQYDFAAPADELFHLGYRHMHALWTHCHWDNPQFTRIPDTLLWNSGTGLLARTFSITPIVFTPYASMKNMRQVIDIGVPPLCKNPYWCTDWTTAPVIGVEPVQAWHPNFNNHRANVDYVKRKIQDKTRRDFATKKLYYPDRETAAIPVDMENRSDRIVRDICLD